MSDNAKPAPENNSCNLSDVSQLHFTTDLFDAMPINKVCDFVLPDPILVHGLLHRGHKMLLYGPVKAGKSFLAADFAIAVASGGEWLGHKCEKGNVFICDIENGAHETQQRIEQICEQRTIGKDCMKHITVTQVKGCVDTTEFVNTMIENIKPGCYSAIIIDSVYNFMNGRESQSEEADFFMREMDRLASALQASVILCHHTRKTTEGYTSAADKASGSTIFVRQAQTLVCIASVYEKDDCKREQIKIIARFFLPHPPVNVVFKDGIFTIVPSNKKGNSTKDVEFKKPKTKQEQKSEKLIKAYENIKNDEGTARVSDLAKVIGVSLNTVKTYIASTDGFKKVKDGYVTYSPANEK